MNKNNKDQNKSGNKDNKATNINPTGQKQDATNKNALKGNVSGVPSQKSGSRGSADVQDGGSDIGSSAGKH
ncbi:hypothetical protein [Pontibacter fetidus]|uniref:Uncharacterized protein n=1 Tax=Pontibacter fetidus TaxID=2700082 RepID=A0A6B2H814_9BACT|nr:hypothetical protein [Pontibacter fetidus]NDK55482.1 hypothetical protein [Pontibacter fetidus]